ncbi:MAG: hypothetical protein AAGB00_11855 [Planctomycetota bacterium]
MPFELPPITPNPVIDAYKPGIDMTLVRENLKLTPTERLEKLKRLVRGIDRLHADGKAFRETQQSQAADDSR